MPDGFQVDDKELVKTKAIVSSMTRDERRSVELFQKQPKRLLRVARGSGRTDREVADLLQRFAYMQKLMGSIGQQAGMLQRLPGMKQLAMSRRLKDAVKTGGLEANPMMANLADQLLEAAVAGDGTAAVGADGSSDARRKADKNKKKNLRKMRKKSRRKSRK